MLTTKDLSKRYGKLRALDAVSIEVEPGEVVAVIGANGAGKSTLLKCIVGLVRFEGQLSVGGVDVAHDPRAARRLIGYLPQNPAFHDDLRVRETAVFYADLNSASHAQAHELVEAVGLGPHAEKRVSELSGGMRQRLGLAVAQLGDPRLIILDEPASGLDVSARLELRALIARQRELGRTVLLSTHWLEDVPHVADRALALDHGRVAAFGPAAGLGLETSAASRVSLRLNGSTASAMPIIDRFAVSGSAARQGDWLVLRVPSGDKVPLVEALIQAGVHILDLRLEEASLQDSPAFAREESS